MIFLRFLTKKKNLTVSCWQSPNAVAFRDYCPSPQEYMARKSLPNSFRLERNGRFCKSSIFAHFHTTCSNHWEFSQKNCGRIPRTVCYLRMKNLSIRPINNKVMIILKNPKLSMCNFFVQQCISRRISYEKLLIWL